MTALLPLAALFGLVIVVGCLAVALNDHLERWLANRRCADVPNSGR